uniref:GTPase Era, mitochondrial n=1 Tax=Glossina brevipalpis TaxID=37001 RepID=A0A1A9WDV7_9MUSC
MRLLLNKLFNIPKSFLLQNPCRLLSKYYHAQAKSVENETQKSLNIAIIGIPNAGKSTFINHLINRRICPTSCKVHTTRKANKAIYTTEQTQLVFYDTPGLVTESEIKKYKLEGSFRSAYRHAAQNADLIAVIHDVSNAFTRKELHFTVIDTLKMYPRLPSILIMNKIDALKSKRITLDLIRTLTNNTLSSEQANKRVNKINKSVVKESIPLKKGGINREVSWSNFSQVFLVSAAIGSGLNDVHDYLIASAKLRPWEYKPEEFTDEAPENLIVDSVKARLLDYLPQEIPYNLETYLEYYSLENDTIYASVEVVCPTQRIERLICGESNGRLRQITERVTSDLIETFGKPISFTIATTSKEKQKINQ